MKAELHLAAIVVLAASSGLVHAQRSNSYFDQSPAGIAQADQLRRVASLAHHELALARLACDDGDTARGMARYLKAESMFRSAQDPRGADRVAAERLLVGGDAAAAASTYRELMHGGFGQQEESLWIALVESRSNHLRAAQAAFAPFLENPGGFGAFGVAIADLPAFHKETLGSIRASSLLLLADIAWSDQGRPKAAETRLRQALELAPENAIVKLKLGELLLNLGRAEEARPYVEEASAALRKKQRHDADFASDWCRRMLRKPTISSSKGPESGVLPRAY